MIKVIYEDLMYECEDEDEVKQALQSIGDSINIGKYGYFICTIDGIKTYCYGTSLAIEDDLDNELVNVIKTLISYFGLEKTDIENCKDENGKFDIYEFGYNFGFLPELRDKIFEVITNALNIDFRCVYDSF